MNQNIDCQDATQIMKKLQEPFNPKDIEWRVARGFIDTNQNKKFVFVQPYITNRAIQARLDNIFTPFGWKNQFKEWRQKSVLCGISILWNNQWITKYDGSDETSIEGTKGGFSASQKRAAVEWGIGRYIYEVPEQKVEVLERGDIYTNTKVTINRKEEYIKGYWNIPKLPDWALPYGSNQKKGSHSEARIIYIKGLETNLDLKEETKLSIFIHVNPNTEIDSVEKIYCESTAKELTNYISAIQHASNIKKECDKNQMSDQVMEMLSNVLNKEIRSFLSLVTIATEYHVELVNDFIIKQRAA